MLVPGLKIAPGHWMGTQDEEEGKTMQSNTLAHAAYTWVCNREFTRAHRHTRPTQEQHVAHLCKGADGVAVHTQRNVSRLGRGLREDVDLGHRALLGGGLNWENVSGGSPRLVSWAGRDQTFIRSSPQHRARAMRC